VAIVKVPLSLLVLLLISRQAGVMARQFTQGSEMTQAEAISAAKTLIYVAVGTGLVALVAHLLCGAALIKCFSGSYLGKRLSVGQSYGTVVGRLLPLLGFVLVIVLLAVGGMLIFVMAAMGGGALALLVGLTLLVVSIVLMLRYYLTTQVIVLENKGVFAGMTRSSTLSAGNRGKLFLLILAVGILTWIIGLGFGWIAGKIAPTVDLEQLANAGSFEEVRQALTHTMMVQNLIGLAGEILIMPITAGAFILFYYDLRIRKEGFDLEMLAEAIGEQAPETETASDAGFPEA